MMKGRKLLVWLPALGRLPQQRGARARAYCTCSVLLFPCPADMAGCGLPPDAAAPAG